MVIGISIGNRLVRLKNQTRESWANVDVALKRRYELIPNLVATVKGYAAHESELLELVISARNAAAAQSGAGDAQARGETELVNKVNMLLARVESYPELRSSQQFLALQKELANTEDRIAAARRFYNHNVKEYNSLVSGFPSSIIAGMQRLHELSYFEVAELGIYQTPSVSGLNPSMVPAQPERPQLSP